MGCQRVRHDWGTELNYWTIQFPKWKSLSRFWLFATPWTVQSMESSRPEYWSGSLSLLHGIFPTQGSNSGLPQCRRILYQLNYKGNPGILEWVAYLFSREFSWPRNRTGVSCIAGGFFTNWAINNSPKVTYLNFPLCTANLQHGGLTTAFKFHHEEIAGLVPDPLGLRITFATPEAVI